MSLPNPDTAFGWVLGDVHTTPEQMYAALCKMIEDAGIVFDEDSDDDETGE